MKSILAFVALLFTLAVAEPLFDPGCGHMWNFKPGSGCVKRDAQPEPVAEPIVTHIPLPFQEEMDGRPVSYIQALI